ncbi:MAG TPA: T9SS type A sorting domain-containing protein [Lentimicrobium sp.]|nr:T9SS type A sorting domain-containing protein [Lentimicrobium sp.]
MKRILPLFAAFLLTTSIFAQSQRLVLLEHFTQASCGPCATYNPSIHSLLVANPDKITSINYHTSWPGYDPMYNHNTVDNAARTSFYNVNSVPNSVLDGNFYNGHPGGWNINTVNQRYAVPSPCNLFAYQRLSPTQDTLFVTMVVEASAAMTGQIAATVAVIEKHIHFNSPPGSNGEKDFYNVMKKLLPSRSGQMLPTPMSAGDYFILESYWVLANVYNINELSLVGYVQNTITKEILQSCNLTPGNYTGLYANDAELVSLPNMTDRYCNETLEPVVKIRNNGNNTVSTLDINYRINEGEIHSYTFTGSLSPLQSVEIQLPETGYGLQDENNLSVWISSLNGVADDYNRNDTIVHDFAKALQASRSVLVKVRTDNNPHETTWEIKNMAGEVVASGGPYTQSGTIINTDVELPADGCYDFFVYDAGGNGICCTNGAGFVRLSSGSVTITQGTDFGAMLTAQFDVLSVGTSLLPATAGLQLYPNPAGETVYAEYTSDFNRTLKITVINQLGQVVYTTSRRAFAGETDTFEINSGNWPAGIYMMFTDDGTTRSSRKFSIAR